MRKNKKQNNLVKGTLLVLIGFLFILLTYVDASVNKTPSSLIAMTEKTYTNVNSKELLSVLDGTGVVLVVNNKTSINRIINILVPMCKEKIYIYNAKNDELVLELKGKKVKTKQESTQEYKELLNRLGMYTENYTLKNKKGKIINTGYRKIYTPMVLFIKDGNIEFSHYIYDERILDEELSSIYKRGLDIINGINY